MNAKLILVLVAALGIEGAAWAAAAEKRALNSQPSAAEHAAAKKATPASDIIGKEIRNIADENIGKITDLLIGHNGKVTEALLSVGGFLGLGEKLVAVPYAELRPGGVDQEYLVYNATRDELEAQPAFKYPEAVKPGGHDGEPTAKQPPPAGITVQDKKGSPNETP